MSRENKKENIASLHRKTILEASEKLFIEKGFGETTISDISAASGYSRRTIYAYYLSKEDILHHIIAHGLSSLKNDIETCMAESGDFIKRCRSICAAMKKYYEGCPLSAEKVITAETVKIAPEALTPAVRDILKLGDEINGLLAGFIEDGKSSGAVRSDVEPMPTVYILWSSISSLLTLTGTKGSFLTRSLSCTCDEFLEYGFRQIINSILVERI
ncbi:MAG: TetR/AcrR family transcriptional regulator [Anaerovoracaceae bacterium]